MNMDNTSAMLRASAANAKEALYPRAHEYHELVEAYLANPCSVNRLSLLLSEKAMWVHWLNGSDNARPYDAHMSARKRAAKSVLRLGMTEDDLSGNFE